MKQAIYALAISFMFVGTAITGMLINHWWNYEVPAGYEIKLRQTVAEMVKTEALKENK